MLRFQKVAKVVMSMVSAVTLTHLLPAKVKVREMYSKDVVHGTIAMMVSTSSIVLRQ